jgi:hypothetical protein
MNGIEIANGSASDGQHLPLLWQLCVGRLGFQPYGFSRYLSRNRASSNGCVLTLRYRISTDRMFIRHRHAGLPFDTVMKIREKEASQRSPFRIRGLFSFAEVVTMPYKYGRWQPRPVLRIKRSHWYLALAATCFLWVGLVALVWVAFQS